LRAYIKILIDNKRSSPKLVGGFTFQTKRTLVRDISTRYVRAYYVRNRCDDKACARAYVYRVGTYIRADWYSWKTLPTGNSTRPAAVRLGFSARFAICLPRCPTRTHKYNGCSIVVRHDILETDEQRVLAARRPCGRFERDHVRKQWWPEHTYGDDLPIGSGDERVFAVHVVEVGEVGLFDLTDGRYQKRSAVGHISLLVSRKRERPGPGGRFENGAKHQKKKNEYVRKWLKSFVRSLSGRRAFHDQCCQNDAATVPPPRDRINVGNYVTDGARRTRSNAVRYLEDRGGRRRRKRMFDRCVGGFIYTVRFDHVLPEGSLRRNQTAVY